MTKQPPQTIAQLWVDFKTNVMPKDAPPVQITEMHRSFYAGAFALLSEFIQVANQDEDDGADWLNSRWDECKEFFTLVDKNNLKGDIANG